jgi:hypothetical protein
LVSWIKKAAFATSWVCSVHINCSNIWKTAYCSLTRTFASVQWTPAWTCASSPPAPSRSGSTDEGVAYY